MGDLLKVGIAGYGVVGQRRRHFIDKHPHLETVAVCDRTFEGAGIFDDGLKYFSSYQELLDVDLDALFVCLSNDVAAEVTMAGLDHGLHVFCEKPPGRDVADIAAVAACEKRHPGLKLKYGFNHRYHDSVRDALKMMRSGELGPVLNMRGVYGKSKFNRFDEPKSWRVHRDLAGGGILLDQGIHLVDLMRLFAGEFSEVHSFVTNNFWKHDIEDNAYALMRTETGVVAMLHSSATQWRHRFSLDISCARGSIELSGILSSSKSYGAETLTVAWATDDDSGDPREQTTRYNQDPSWADEISEFAEAIIENQAIVNGSAKDALRTVQLVYQIYCADPDWKARWNLSDQVPSEE